MKENHEIDKLLRDALAGNTLQPSDESRKMFLDKAVSMTPVAKQTHHRKIMWVSGIIILLLSGIILLWLPDSGDKTDSLNTPLTTTEKFVESAEYENITPETLSDEKGAIPPILLNEPYPSISLNKEDTQNQSNLLQPDDKVQHSTHAQAAPMDSISETTAEEQGTEDETTFEKEVAETSEIEQKPGIDAPESEASLKLASEMKTDHHRNWGISLFYRPEMIFNIIENDKLIHNAGFEIQYRFFGDRYSMRTGAALSVSKGYYEYAAVYNQFLGTYSVLDSISFTLAANNFHLIPTYYKSEKDVHDTSTKTDYAKVFKQHIYLQIPLEFGYDFIMQPKYRMGFRFGPTLSVLANRKPVSFAFDPGKDKLIQINRITPERIKTNFHFSGGINYSYLINGFVVEAEPRVAYYFNSVYEKSNTSSPPFSFSIRIAIGIY
ncbi:MAG: hypothetical protein KG029_13975 [Bacteroidetes bacterium]|nr:hypothetical protein [Bacteroidota bacterium]